MPLTPEERKAKLGTGGLARIARRLKLSKGHVSQVNRLLRPDPRVERAITKAITRTSPELTRDEIWPIQR